MNLVDSLIAFSVCLYLRGVIQRWSSFFATGGSGGWRRRCSAAASGRPRWQAVVVPLSVGVGSSECQQWRASAVSLVNGSEWRASVVSLVDGSER
nr:hypothetical protein Iba_scaffold30267CG0030 [Ipomoea batatas]GMC74956.1 hypothetical protein Iba_scaffold34255CG0010 [Ipomoea batatas]GME18526.1 hypothetical protein Iba_scaffold20742CG0030 [Ipomoea batatas]